MVARDTRNQRLKRASAERRAQRKADLRREMLTAATDLFLSEGYENFSLRPPAAARGWALMILLPGWRWSERIVRSPGNP